MGRLVYSWGPQSDGAARKTAPPVIALGRRT